ncbi:hypothetical protein ACFFHW_11565 [Kushneria aurantia]|uniref:CBM6 domain-containing protein n=2 Tax=Kushneria aurantia TaxID=504092 RepID=A0ABV6G4M3_9GAMM
MRKALLITLMAVSAPAVAGADSETVTIDFSSPNGDFHGGATGTLYGLADPGVPSRAVLAGARVTNSSQKPPEGRQHPNGDVLQIEKPFFNTAGRELYVYIQDDYPDWPYNGGHRPGDANGDGRWDYLDVVHRVVERIATDSEYPRQYVFIPFNEPDGDNWYPDWSNQKAQFLADWSAAYQEIRSVYAEHDLGHARIGGPGDTTWRPQRSEALLRYARQRNELPDIFIWHELGKASLGTFRTHFENYQTLLPSLDLPDIPVNITEYGNLRDMGVPGQLVQWLSLFESEKVDAQTAYWNYAGNLSDNSARTNGANGGWWIFKWYGDLAGSKTVALTPPQVDTPDTLQGLATLDEQNASARILLGGGSQAIEVQMHGLPSALFGNTIDVVVRADRLNGAEGLSELPPVVVSKRLSVRDGNAAVTIPNDDRYSAYRVLVTPPQANRPAVSDRLVDSTEAENASLTGTDTRYHDPDNPWDFMASNSHDIGPLETPDASASWTVTAPADGRYRLSVLAAAHKAPGQHALFVDGQFRQLVKYPADLSATYRGTTDVAIDLSAGQHALSLRASRDGSVLLPGAGITLDRFDLTDITHGVVRRYPATSARLDGSARLDWRHHGDIALGPDGEATFYVAATESGYHDISLDEASFRGEATIIVNGQPIGLETNSDSKRTDHPGMRLWLPVGISQISVRGDGGLAGITTTRGETERAADADPANVITLEAETLALSGKTRATTIAPSVGSNGSADDSGAVTKLVHLGNGSSNTATMMRPEGFGAGHYVFTISAANAALSNAINYNPQVVTRFLDISENGGQTSRLAFRHNYSWNSFWQRSMALDLQTDDGAIVLGNAESYGPDIDTVTLSRRVAVPDAQEPHEAPGF